MENLEFEYKDGVLRVMLSGELDHHIAGAIRDAIDGEFYKCRPGKLVLDMSGLQFMDSSGLGLMMGRYSRAASCGCDFAVCGLDERGERILHMSGMDKIIKVEKKV